MISFGVGIATGTEGLMYPVPFSTVRDIIDFSVLAERLGFDAVWGNDHIHTPAYVARTFDEPPRFYAPLLVLAAIAEHTARLKLGTAILVLPFRQPAVVAKEVSTLDQLSGGRVLLGVGIGAYREEFEAEYGRHAKKINRGVWLDESLQVIRHLFMDENVSFSGQLISVDHLKQFPKPVQDPLPIYLGGNSQKSFERIAKFGQGWLPAGLTVAELKKGMALLSAACEEHERSVSSIDVAPQFGVSIDLNESRAHERYQQSQHYKHSLSLKHSTYKGRDIENYAARRLVGTPEQISERIHDYIEAGVTNFAALMFADNSLNGAKEQMQLFAEDVLPRFKRS